MSDNSESPTRIPALRQAWPPVAVVVWLALAPPAVADTQRGRWDPEPGLDVEHVVARILSIDGDAAYGGYLGGECVTCHQQSGEASGIPPITGLPAEYTVRALVEYKLGVRSNDVMSLMTARLSDEEIAALAAYFSDSATD